jgi:hypothetical protein
MSAFAVPLFLKITLGSSPSQLEQLMYEMLNNRSIRKDNFFIVGSLIEFDNNSSKNYY